MVLLKIFNGTLSACDRFILKIFFYGVERMSMEESFKKISYVLILLDISLIYGGILLKILMPM
jgi:hypothetical protein